MKKIIFTLMVALLTAAAIAQPPGAKLRKTTTTTVDTVITTISPTLQIVSDSAVLLKIEELRELVSDQHKTTSDRIRSIRESLKSSGTVGNFINAAMRNLIPIIPFIALIFVVLFWLRYLYKRKLLRQDLIIRYIDRGECVPDWLTRGEIQMPINGNSAARENGSNEVKPTGTNAKIFLVFSLILAVWAIIWIVALLNTNGWRSSIVLLIAAFGFAYATIWCFQQYLKRTE